MTLYATSHTLHFALFFCHNNYISCYKCTCIFIVHVMIAVSWHCCLVYICVCVCVCMCVCVYCLGYGEFTVITSLFMYGGWMIVLDHFPEGLSLWL